MRPAPVHSWQNSSVPRDAAPAFYSDARFLCHATGRMGPCGNAPGVRSPASGDSGAAAPNGADPRVASSKGFVGHRSPNAERGSDKHELEGEGQERDEHVKYIRSKVPEAYANTRSDVNRFATSPDAFAKTGSMRP